MKFIHGQKILANALIVFGSSFVAGFIIGFAAAAAHLDPQPKNTLLILFGWLATLVGFVIVGLRTPREVYWGSLSCTAVVVWILSLIQLAFGSTVLQWALSIIMIMVMMGVGGGLALLLKRS